MKRTTRQEANAEMTRIDNHFQARIEAIGQREHAQVSEVCAEGLPDDVRDLLIRAIRVEATRARKEAHDTWLADIQPWAQQVVGATV